MLEEDRVGLERALEQRRPLATAASWLAETLERGGDAILVGAGTSGRLAVLEAAECPPTFGTAPERIRAAIAGGEQAVFRAAEGAEDDERAGRQLGEETSAGDLVLGISASSVTAFPAAALAAARERGARTVLLTCASLERQPELAGLADLVIALDTGAEVLTGSTRLKAGSATKAALNAITTAAMVRLGKTYDNLMVDLRPGSAKLRDRAERIVATAASVDAEAARRLLRDAGGDVKRAIVMGLAGVDAEEAAHRLERSRGHVRAAIDLSPVPRSTP